MERSPGEDAFSIDELSHAKAVAEFLADDIDSRDAAYDANSLDERRHGQFALSVAELGHTSALVEPLAKYAPDSLDKHIRSEFELSVEERGHSRVVAERGHVPDSLDGAYGTKSVNNNLVISLDDVYVMDSLPNSVDNTCITESLECWFVPDSLAEEDSDEEAAAKLKIDGWIEDCDAVCGETRSVMLKILLPEFY